MAPGLGLETTESELAPLPSFLSEEIRTQVFTHRSLYGRPNHIFEDHPDDPSPDNERLEHMGDTVLSLVVTGMMIEMFPTLRVGPSTKIRAMVVSNPTLASIAVRYKLPDHLRLHPAQALTLKSSPHVQADLFEAYVGGIFKDQGLEVVQQWLVRLLRPYALAAYRIVRTQHGLSPDPEPVPSNPLEEQRSPPRSPYGYVNSDMTMTTVGHLSLFNQHIQKENRRVEWQYTPTNPAIDPSALGDEQLISPGLLRNMKATPIWFVKVIVDGELLGQGKGGTKKIARNEAAKRGLERLGVEVYPDLYFKPPIGFRGPRFLPWSSYHTKAVARRGEGDDGNSQRDFFRLKQAVTPLFGLISAIGLKRETTCSNVKRSWVEEGHRPASLLLNISKLNSFTSVVQSIKLFSVLRRLYL
ncbi:hypothetical protein D9757_001175 [Collybiopsis confluens]|uniref:Uncharacterized protein n=1 Tax=Collybiopsis confluens TaxID=2823264 RepID=A0A8H5MGN6_9AGAR|nr:hypothetical protein D9757_001175 [Collybiopsis confluens]